MGREGGHLKFPKTWAFVVHPLGYDPYESLATSYLVDTAQRELLKVKKEITDAFVKIQEKRAEVALPPPPAPQVVPFSPEHTMPELPL